MSDFSKTIRIGYTFKELAQEVQKAIGIRVVDRNAGLLWQLAYVLK